MSDDEPCSGDMSNVAMIECFVERLDAAEAVCVAAIGKIRQHVEPALHARIKANHSAWLSYRDEHCTISGEAYRGGLHQPLAELICRLSLTEARHQALERLAESHAEM